MIPKEDQLRVYEWLNDELNLPVFADAYQGAVEMLEQKPHGYISFVAHAGRDLMNILTTTFLGISPKQVQYHDHLDKLNELWEHKWGTRDGFTNEKNDNGYFIPFNVCNQISKLINDHKSGKERSYDKDSLFFRTFLDYNDKDKIPKNFMAEWKNSREWFVKHAHLRDKTFSKDVDNVLNVHFKCLHGYLYIASTSQFERLKEFNEILESTNR